MFDIEDADTKHVTPTQAQGSTSQHQIDEGILMEIVTNIASWMRTVAEVFVRT